MEQEIKMTGDLSRISDESKEFIDKKIKKFTDKASSNFKNMELKIDCKIHKETSRGRPAYYCKVVAFTDKGNFNADNQEFGGAKTIVGALEKVERQFDKEFTRKKG